MAATATAADRLRQFLQRALPNRKQPGKTGTLDKKNGAYSTVDNKKNGAYSTVDNKKNGAYSTVDNKKNGAYSTVDNKKNGAYSTVNGMVATPDYETNDNRGDYETYDEMLSDPHICACILTKKYAIAQKAAEKSTPDQIAYWSGVPGGLSSLYLNLLDALVWGFAVGELRTVTDTQTGAVRPVGVTWHDPRRFVFRRDNWGDLSGIATTDEPDEWLPPRDFIHWAHRSQWNDPYGVSDLAACVDVWERKKRKNSLWLDALERHGTPTPVARVPIHWRDDEMQQLANRLSAMRHGSSLVVSDEVQLSTPLDMSKTLAHAAYLESIEWENREISRAILGQELTTQSSGQGQRSLAMAQVQERNADVWYEAVAADLVNVVPVELL